MEILSRWMLRDNPTDSEAYIHLTQHEKIEWVKKGIREDTTKGILNDAFHSLSLEERDLFLDGQIQAAHFTHLGVCVHDFAVSPCEFHLNCVKGCPDYLRNKGDQRERKQLVQIKSRTEKALEDAELAERMGTAVMSPSWVKHHKATLEGIDKTLSIDDDLESSETPIREAN